MRTLGLVLVALAACAEPPPRPAPAPPAPTPSSAPRASVSATASAPPAVVAPPPPSPAPSPFHEAVRSSDEGEPLALALVGSKLFVVAQRESVIAAIDGDRVAWDPKLYAGLASDFLNQAGTGTPSSVIDLAGSWPGHTWLVTLSGTSPRAGGFEVHAWKQTHWVPQHLPSSIARYGWLRPWGKDRFFLSYDQTSSPDVPMPFVLLAGPPAPSPKMPCFAAPADAATTRGGEIFVLGAVELACRGTASNPSGYPVVFAWDARGRGPRTILLPASFAGESLVARAADDVWIAGVTGSATETKPAVAHFDGSRVEVSELPGEGNPHSIAAEPDGTLWVAGALFTKKPAGLWRKPPGGAWTSVPLPEVKGESGPDVPSPWQVVARGNGDVWLSCSLSKGSVVFHTGAVSSVYELPSREARWTAMRALGRKDVPLPICNRVLVELSAAEADPAKRVAAGMKGVTLQRATRAGSPALVATIPDVATGERLAARVGHGARLVCDESSDLVGL